MLLKFAHNLYRQGVYVYRYISRITCIWNSEPLQAQSQTWKSTYPPLLLIERARGRCLPCNKVSLPGRIRARGVELGEEGLFTCQKSEGWGFFFSLTPRQSARRPLKQCWITCGRFSPRCKRVFAGTDVRRSSALSSTWDAINFTPYPGQTLDSTEANNRRRSTKRHAAIRVKNIYSKRK